MSDDALPLLEELAKNDPKQSRFQMHLAQCYLALGRREDAKQILEALITADLNPPQAEDAKGGPPQQAATAAAETPQGDAPQAATSRSSSEKRSTRSRSPLPKPRRRKPPRRRTNSPALGRGQTC